MKLKLLRSLGTGLVKTLELKDLNLDEGDYIEGAIIDVSEKAGEVLIGKKLAELADKIKAPAKQPDISHPKAPDIGPAK